MNATLARLKKFLPVAAEQDTVSVLLGPKLACAEPELAVFLREEKFNPERLYAWIAKGNVADAEIDRRRMQILRLGETLIRQTVAHRFQDFTNVTYAEELRAWLLGSDCHRQTAAILGLVSLGDSSGIDALLAGLQKPSFFIVWNRYTAVSALCRIHEPRCLPLFLAELDRCDTGSDFTNHEVVAWLGKHGGSEAVAPLCRYLDRQGFRSEGEAQRSLLTCEALAELGDVTAVPSLWVAMTNARRASAPAQTIFGIRSALVRLAGEQRVSEWERENDG